MKKYLFLAFAFLAFMSCSRDDENQNECKILSAKTYNYLFNDVAISISSYDYNFKKFTFEYDSQNRISKVVGGIVPSVTGDMGSYYLSDKASDEITYSGNNISVKVSANLMIRPYDKEFVIENGKIVSKKITYLNYPNATPVVYNYEYLENTVTERLSGILNNRITRTFEIQDGNLSKVTELIYDLNGNVKGKTEIIFSEYDKQQNLLKGKFFVNGAFYASFSNNIYHKRDSNSYDLVNGVYVFKGNNNYVTYSSEVISNYFEKICN